MIEFFIGLVVGLLIGRLWRHRPSGLSFHKGDTYIQGIKKMAPGAQPRVK